MSSTYQGLASYYQHALADDREADAIAQQVAQARTAAGTPTTKDIVWLEWRQQARREVAAQQGRPHAGLTLAEQSMANGLVCRIARQAAQVLAASAEEDRRNAAYSDWLRGRS